MKRFGAMAVAVVTALLSMSLLTGCGSNNTTGTAGGTFQDDSKSTCFQELDQGQKQDLQKYAADKGDTINQTTNSDGTQDICVLERQPDGSYNEHYYNRNDHFGDYLLYSMMFGRSNALLAYGAFNGDLSASDVLVLSMLSGVNSQGVMYHPYSNSSGQWLRSPSVVNNVTNVYYGNSTPTKYSSSLTPPVGYAAKAMPSPSDKEATASKTGITQASSTGARDLIQKKTGSVAGTTKLPASGSGSGSNTGSGSGSVQKAPAQKAPAPAQKAPTKSK